MSEHLWSYDGRNAQWRLDVNEGDSHRQSRHRNISLRQGGHGNANRQRKRLSHYIAAGGMRLHWRAQRAEREPLERQGLIWRILLLFLLFWLFGRWLYW